MKSAFQIINRMVADGVIGTYAVGGAVAALNYIEPMLTDDLDVLIPVDQLPNQPRSGLATLEPVFAYLRNAGYTEFKREGIVVEGWPVRFLPVASDLDAESPQQIMTLQHRMASPEIDRVLAQELGNSYAVPRTADFESGRNNVLGSERSDCDCRCATTDFDINFNCLGKAAHL